MKTRAANVAHCAPLAFGAILPQQISTSETAVLQPLIPTETDRPFLHLLAEATVSLNASVLIEPTYRHIGEIHHSNTRRVFVGNALSVNADAASALAADKTYTANRLAAAGLPTAPGCLIVSDRFRRGLALKSPAAARALPPDKTAQTFAETHGYPVFVKPNKGAEGADVTCANNPKDLQADVADLLSHTTHARIEAAIPGADYRLLVLDGRVRAAYRRASLTITGDGTSSVADLIATKLDALSQTGRGRRIASTDPRLVRSLTAAKLTLDDIPHSDQTVALLPNANLSTGGTLTDLTDQLPQTAAEVAIRAADTLRLRLAGVDLMAERLTQPTLLEINSAPGLDAYAQSSAGAWANARQILIDALTAPNHVSINIPAGGTPKANHT
ncbi:hypothetical protein [Actibacterium sp. 188UL27-1]|uniref:hypothetical protein n=1 Tax=Actibacterium sp. 188UL27-1 TaxID=2786961 RepID=UPI00195B1F50|nr:hypothetical protein [Actibacterium sp. 188UL27-1]MBM7066253.1 hypothetical protein [Actibacterium sp. 188UL27-1]